ncbi:MAG: glycine zipper 2TM domain-containing protein [Steroidobacteraceae bacterium]
MNKSFLIGAGAGGALAVVVGAGAMVRHKLIRHAPAYARVVQVVPLMRTVVQPRRVCRDATVERTRPAQDTHQIIGSVAGALIGGLLGNQIGDGSGRDVATVAGAAAGGYAGNRIEARMQRGDTYRTTVRRCATVYDRIVQPNGYEVRYRLGGKTGTVRMAHDPGQRIAVRNGQLVLGAHSAGSAAG